MIGKPNWSLTDNFMVARHPPGIQQLFGTNSQNETSPSGVDVR
jgi:hypothetical protein